ncbi:MULTISPECIES: hypothetical protein [Microbulbifer]|uniref:bestrophin-like domain n=1 Tax=Microbulbifer TaxID=48073 RepID=UPI001E52E70A|nr:MULTISPECIES: hypothetical protein [Microbulbifer]UHQ53802.1 hypothetical protein LVE68_09775 [Microbulbifer sp. YPW16]
MYAEDLFHTMPLAAVYVLTVLFVLAALGAGLVVGRWSVHRYGEQKESSMRNAITATLGLLAFLLAFTFNMTADRFNQRKALLVEEVNAIHTAYLHADFLVPDAAARARSLLAAYTDLRDFDPLKEKITADDLLQSERLHQQLWELVDEHVAEKYDAGYLRQFVEPVSDVINKHYSRVVVGLEFRIPTPIWLALYFMTALAMLAIGYQFGISRGGSVHVAVTLAITFSTAILLIADLDRATEGTLVIEQRPMAELNEHLKRAEKARRDDTVPDVH